MSCYMLPGRTTLMTLGVAACLLLSSRNVHAQLDASLSNDGYRVGFMELQLVYEGGDERMPAVATLMRQTVRLRDSGEGIAAWREGTKGFTVTLNQINQFGVLPDRIFYQTAIEQIISAVEKDLAQRGFPGTQVKLAAGQIDADGSDRRVDRQVLRLVITPPADLKQVPRLGVSDFEVQYVGDRRGLPAGLTVLNAPITLAVAEGGLMPAAPGFDIEQGKVVQLDSFSDGVFYLDAIQQMVQAVGQQYARSGYVGVEVELAPGQISDDGQDLRRASRTLVLNVRADRARSTVDQITQADGGWYPVSKIGLMYEPARDELPAVEKILNAPLVLGETESGLVAYRPGLVKRETTIGQLTQDKEVQLYASAVRTISAAVVEQVNQAGFFGVIVTPENGQFDSSGADLRPEYQNDLKLVIHPGTVGNVTTVAVGDRFGDDEDRDRPEHKLVRKNSPLAATSSSGEPDLVKQKAVEQYVHYLNRHPGRHVNVAVTGTESPGSYALEYMVQESKPWIVYAQVSNTGTSQTSQWRERFGFVHHQLTNHDDILRLDYITASFDESHALVGSYEAPAFVVDRLRWRVSGMYSQYTASDIGILGEDYQGDSWSYGGELIYNIYQANQFFVDVIGGLRYMNIHAENELLLTDAEEALLIPSLGVRMDQVRVADAMAAGVSWETNLDDIAATDQDEAEFLGRGDVDTTWQLLRFDASYSVYIDALLAGLDALNATAPPVQQLVHELAFSGRGQFILDGNRVFPQLQQTAGGFYSVRGYEESESVGDDAILLTFEYRYHLPRQLAPGPEGTLFNHPFHWAPPHANGRPDWDLIFRAFVDYGHVSSNEPRVVTESDDDLLGAGVGIELQLKRNLNLRVDWAAAINDVEGGSEAGDNRFHFVGTLLY